MVKGWKRKVMVRQCGDRSQPFKNGNKKRKYGVQRKYLRKHNLQRLEIIGYGSKINQRCLR